MTEEMWERAGFGGTVTDQKWPVFDPEKCRDAQVEIAAQVCGKIKARVMVDADAPDAELLAAVKTLPEVQAALEGKTIVKEIVVKGKLVNIVAR